MTNGLGSTTDFEVRSRLEVPADEGLVFVYSYTSWWSRPDEVSSAGGLTRNIGFVSPELAMAWCHEQFEVPVTGWSRRPDGIYVTAKGAPFPDGAGYRVPGRAGLANPDACASEGQGLHRPAHGNRPS
jgi:hypothetical protein